jgi:hypothetical protein
VTPRRRRSAQGPLPTNLSAAVASPSSACRSAHGSCDIAFAPRAQVVTGLPLFPHQIQRPRPDSALVAPDPRRPQPPPRQPRSTWSASTPVLSCRHHHSPPTRSAGTVTRSYRLYSRRPSIHLRASPHRRRPLLRCGRPLRCCLPPPQARHGDTSRAGRGRHSTRVDRERPVLASSTSRSGPPLHLDSV